ncbi:hypothetical protein DX927_03955 [Bacillus swezeyi]|uniref:Uncharacterized protein n=1 Tax=Bacillus swezeyi TaxID=1925020 RepID=A0A5M8S035_9BACI|nr:hypothetical protein DX927_03955 [Bacillus swezeyi]
MFHQEEILGEVNEWKLFRKMEIGVILIPAIKPVIKCIQDSTGDSVLWRISGEKHIILELKKCRKT